MHNSRPAFIAAVLLVGLACIGALWIIGTTQQTRDTAALNTSSWGALLEAGNAARQTSEPARELAFPFDHGPHPAHPLETWYVSGTLVGQSERLFAYQMMMTRLALSGSDLALQRTSAWASTALFRAHIVLTDAHNGTRYEQESVQRAAIELSGSRAQPTAVWVGNWRLDIGNESTPDASTASLHAEHGDTALNLSFEAQFPPMPMTRQQVPPTTNATFYTWPRLRTRGNVRTRDGVHNVTGFSWLDHAWGDLDTGARRGAVIWDRFRLNLHDGRDLLLLRLRRLNGTGTPIVSGIWVDDAGRSNTLDANDATLTVLGTKQDNRSGTHFPTRWELRIGTLDLELQLSPLVVPETLSNAQPYWADGIQALHADGSLAGSGFVELLGYDGRTQGTQSR